MLIMMIKQYSYKVVYYNCDFNAAGSRLIRPGAGSLGPAWASDEQEKRLVQILDNNAITIRQLCHRKTFLPSIWTPLQI